MSLPLFPEQLPSWAATLWAMASPRAASLRPQPPSAFSRSGIAIAKARRDLARDVAMRKAMIGDPYAKRRAAQMRGRA